MFHQFLQQLWVNYHSNMILLTIYAKIEFQDYETAVQPPSVRKTARPCSSNGKSSLSSSLCLYPTACATPAGLLTIGQYNLVPSYLVVQLDPSKEQSLSVSLPLLPFSLAAPHPFHVSLLQLMHHILPVAAVAVYWSCYISWPLCG